MLRVELARPIAARIGLVPREDVRVELGRLRATIGAVATIGREVDAQRREDLEDLEERIERLEAIVAEHIIPAPAGIGG